MFPYTTCLRFKRKTCTSAASGQAGSVDQKNSSVAEQPQSSATTASNILRFKWMGKDKDELKNRSHPQAGGLKPKRPSKLPITKDIATSIDEDSIVNEDQTTNTQAPRLSTSSIKYVDDTDTGTDILSELNALSEQITDTSNNLTPTIGEIEPYRLTTSATLTNAQIGGTRKVSDIIGDSVSVKERTTLDNRSDESAALSTPLSSKSLSRPLSALSVQSTSSSISATLAHPQLRPSCSNDLRHYQVKGSSTITTQVPWNNITTVQSTATSKQSTAICSENRFFSRPNSTLDRRLNTRQSLDSNELKLSEQRKDLRCVDQTRCLLTLRRKAELRKHKALRDSVALDLAYSGPTLDRFLLNTCCWNFNSFTLDLLTGGHSLSQMLVYFFCKYNFIKIYNLDMTAVWKCFRLFENGYHDTNPYHNCVHAADVSQAMQCFIEQKKIKPYLTSLESMCSLLAAVAHDLDHPGVNQHFLVATNSHLAALYQNLSVLESHHWRFAMSCIHESEIFAHFEPDQMQLVQNYISQLILATDITQQQAYLARFRTLLGYGRPRSPCSTNQPSQHTSPQHLIKSSIGAQLLQPYTTSAKTLAAPSLTSSYYTSSGGQSPVRFVRTPSDKRRPFSIVGSSVLEGTGVDLTATIIKTTNPFTGTMMDALRLHIADNDFSTQPIDKYQLDLTNPDHRLFILQIALKCADLGNPCRVWPLSKQWAQQICTEFYRQGDFERRLNMQVSPICDKNNASMAQIQTEFFRNIVSPLFCLWHRFLNSSLSRRMICNLTFNNAQWLSTQGKAVSKRRHSISSCTAGEYAKIINKQTEHALSEGRMIPAKQITASLSMSDLNEEDHPLIRKLFKRKGTPEWSIHFSRWLDDQRSFSDSIQLPHLSDVVINVIEPTDNQLLEENDNFTIDSFEKYSTALQHSSSFSNRQDTTSQRFIDSQTQTIHPLLSSTSTGRISENKNKTDFELFASTLQAISPQLLQTAHLNERRGSAPCCTNINIDIYMLMKNAHKSASTNGSNINNTTPVLFPRKLSSRYLRRSSFPVADFSPNCIQLATSKKSPPGKIATLTTVAPVNASQSKNCSQQFKELTMESMKRLIQTGRHAFSLDSNSECKQSWLISNKPRRSSIPQEILIESIRNYK